MLEFHRTVVGLVFYFLLVPLSSGSSYYLNYSAAAKKIVPRELEDLNRELLEVDGSMMPHDVKELRRKIGRVRALVDFFSYAYPEKEWSKMRNNLDDGYDHFGSFKDLFDLLGLSKDDVQDSDYVLSDIIKRRSKALEWRTEFQTLFYDEGYILQAGRSVSGQYTPRQRDQLPKYYWQNINFVPVDTIKLRDNIIIASRELIIRTGSMIQGIEEIDNIFDEHQQEIFHEVRKRVRTVLKLAKYFKPLFTDEFFSSQKFQKLSDFVSQMGQINDRFIALHYYELKFITAEDLEKENYKRKIELQRKAISEMWPTLIQWFRVAKISKVFNSFIKSYDYSSSAPLS